jgi:predicted ArsR family transcriptional regulator
MHRRPSSTLASQRRCLIRRGLHAMKILFERTASPKEIAVELGLPVNNVTHHINVLLKLGCIELVGMESAQGGRVVKHLYRTIRRAYFDADMWEQLNDREKLDVMATLVGLISHTTSAELHLWSISLGGPKSPRSSTAPPKKCSA